MFTLPITPTVADGYVVPPVHPSSLLLEVSWPVHTCTPADTKGPMMTAPEYVLAPWPGGYHYLWVDFETRFTIFANAGNTIEVGAAQARVILSFKGGEGPTATQATAFLTPDHARQLAKALQAYADLITSQDDTES